ncbi:MAG: TonB-dependent receptor plug domain-containing protein [Alistipes sp.]|nr:TonB-dependent receptor plug domain-containing protein [Alistipes sp.]
MFQRILLVSLLVLSPLFAKAQQDSLGTSYNIDDVVVATRQQAVSSPDKHGNVSLNMEALNIMPRIGGSVNALKLLQYTPGVTAVEEGNTAMYVRGSDIGQCITLLDGAPVYSPSHLIGIFSVFNSAHLSGMTLYKSGIPAMYGSASSSVLSVRTHRYIPSSTKITANVGLIESDIAVGLPIGKRFALYATARHSYVSWLTKLILNKNSTVKYEFGDYGVGFVADVGKAGRLTMNTHFNNDVTNARILIYNSKGHLKWWNALATLTLDTQLSDDVSLTNTVYSSLYDNALQLNIISSNLSVLSKVQDYGVRSMVNANFDKIDLSAGVNYSLHRILPQDIRIADLASTGTALIENSHETALFANSVWRANEHLELEIGLRLSLYNNQKLWCYPEPRVMLSVPINHTSRFWAGYNRLAQYVLLVPQSNMSFATDFHIGASEDTPPQLSDNFSLGYSQALQNNALNWSAELFYRRMTNAIEYESNILTLINGDKNNGSRLHCGVGEAYGLETSVGYNDSHFDLQLNYTLSKSLRQFDQLNDGIAFAANSDRRHNVSFIASYKCSPRWTFSTSFIYASGAPYTATKALYISGNAIIKEVSSYNGARLPDLHHLDVSATYWLKCRKLKYSGINLSVYNVYAHKNPNMLSWSVKFDDDGTIRLKEHYHILYSILPSVSWVMKF